MQTEAGTLALSADGRVGQPDLGDELQPPELGQHPGIDPVRLAGQRGEPLHLDRVGDPHIPTSQLELVVDEAGATHRLDHRQHRLVRSAQAQHQRSERVRGNGAGLEALPVRQRALKSRRLRLRSNPTYNMGQASSVLGFATSRVCSPRRPSFMGFDTSRRPARAH